MKFRKIGLVTSFILIAATSFTSCSKDDGAIPERVQIEDVPAVTTNLETGGVAANITFSNQAAFQGRFKVALFFAGATPPTKVDVVVRKNASAANVKLFKANIASLPATFDVTAADIAALFGTALALNDTYDFAPDIYVNGKKYEAFPAASSGSGQSLAPLALSSIGYGEYVRYSVK